MLLRITATQPTGKQYYPTIFIPVEEGTKSIEEKYINLAKRIEGEVLHGLWGNLSESGKYRYRMMVRSGFDTPEEAIRFAEEYVRTRFADISEEEATHHKDISI